jgi:tetratricopeptide (TPR) repeat protein
MLMMRCLCPATVVIALCSVAPLARADTPEDQARALYQQALTHYNLAEYDQAIELFKQAYALSKAPGLLFNIAQSYRLKMDCEQALRVYKNYQRLDEKGAQGRDVDGLIHDMQTCVDHSAVPPGSSVAPAAAKPPVPAAAPPAAVAVAPAEPSAGRTQRTVGLALGGAGAALLVGGVVFGLKARSDADQVNQLAQMQGVWNDHYKQIESSGQTASTTAGVLLGVGAAAAVTGAVLYYMGSRRARATESRLSLAFSMAEAGVRWSCAF